MSRNTDPAVTSASQLPQQRYRLLVDVDSVSAPLHACTGDRFLYTLNTTYTPIGALGGIEAIQEDGDPFPRSVRMWLTIANTAVIGDAVSESLFRKRVTIRRVIASDSYTTVGSPQIAFKGRINGVSFQYSDPVRGNFLETEVESRLRQAPAGGFLTRDVFQLRVSTTTDTFLDYLTAIPGYQPTWGAAFAAPNNLSATPPTNRPPTFQP